MTNEAMDLIRADLTRLKEEISYEFELIKTLRAENARLREALALIKEYMGGDDLDGWKAPENVWGVADSALKSTSQNHEPN